MPFRNPRPTPRTTSRPTSTDTSTDPFLALRSLTPGHGGHAVCGPVTLDVPRGAAVAVVGPNGSGKSTLLRTLTGQLHPVAGETRYRGAVVDERDQAVRASVATVVDDDAYFPELTVAEHLVMVAAAHGAADPLATVDAELTTFGLDRCRDAVPHTLSSGQRRRLLLAAAFVRPADLLVIDEPEQRLDADARRLVLARLAAARAAGAATVIATHDPAFLAACERVVVVGDVTRLVAADEAAGELGAA